MRVEPKYLILSSALLLGALPALASGETSGVAPSAPPTAVIRCPGGTPVPFTSDAEQSLPLHIIGPLTCGETVTVLSLNEGYTAQIRTADGQEGYVAQMYLSNERSAAVLVKKGPVSSASPVNGVVRWASGAAGCDEFISHGRHVESITANGITVQVSLQDSGWKYRANIAVSNQSADKVEVLPGIVTLDELTPTLHSLLATNPDKLAHTTTHQVFWTLQDAVPSPSALANYSNYVSAEQRLANRPSPTPDYLNPQFALTSTHHVTFERAESVDVQSIALKASSVPSGQITAGVMWFERDSNARELSMRVPVGDLVYDFSFSLEQKK
jgi:hypothetical protein